MTNQRIGYGRVSTTDQNTNDQEDALTGKGDKQGRVDRLFLDTFTGTVSNRPEWNRCRETLRRGDTLVVTRLDRLGRSTRDLLEISAWLEAEGVHLEVLEQPIDTSTDAGKLFFTMISAFAEFEHSMMKARTKDGLAAARARGRVGGRKPKLSDRQRTDIAKRYSEGASPTDLAADYGVSRQTIYRVVEEAKPKA